VPKEMVACKISLIGVGVRDPLVISFCSLTDLHNFFLSVILYAVYFLQMFIVSFSRRMDFVKYK